ncbi:hypothetical protein [Bacteroides sp. AM54-2NS]|nr:hypothetical protein [Bacteroides sp. AM54-2NS]
MDKKSVLLSLWQKFVNRFYKAESVKDYWNTHQSLRLVVMKSLKRERR